MLGRDETMKPVLAVTLGDAAGIGPELVAKIIADGFLEEVSRPVIVGDRRVLERGGAVAGVSLSVDVIEPPWDKRSFRGVRMVDTGDLDPADVKLGEVGALAGGNAGACLIKALDYCRDGLADAVVFAPLNKAALKKAGYDYESEHALFAKHFQVSGPHCEVNVAGEVMTSRVTSHIPLKDVSSSLSIEGILDAVRLIDATSRKTGLARPRIAVAGLNPHNGESGTCGREEMEIIRPAVERAVAEDINVFGPFSADTLFIRALNNGEFDAIVTMYHDQGQIALKLFGFDQGVTLAGGIPVPIATPAHGTAFDIVGRNLARTGATKHAVRLAARMACAALAAAK